MAKCKFCGKEIAWVKEGRKNVPIESDGGKHACTEMSQSLKSIKKIDVKSLSPEELAKYQRPLKKPIRKSFKKSYKG